MPHRIRRPNCRHAPTPKACAALLPRLIALEASLTKLATPRGLAEAPPPLVKLAHDLVNETRALLSGSGAFQAKVGTPSDLIRGSATSPSGARTGTSQRDHSRRRKAALPRIPLNAPISHAELAVIAGQARAALAAFISAEGLDKPAAPRTDIEALRKKLADRIEQIVAERVAQARE